MTLNNQRANITRLHLIRHGETNWNAEGRIQGQCESVLSELGQQQAVELQKKLAATNFDRVFSSSSTRAQQTAALALSHCEQPVNLQDDLREIMLGPWEGHLYADIEKVEPQAVFAFRNTPHVFNVEGAETFHVLQRRALNAVETILNDCSGMEVALVSHGVWIKSVLSHYEGRPLSRFWEPPRMHNCCHSIIEVSEDSGEPRIIRYADLDEGF
ncbi:MAG: histidine phosphatase family protein [Porticoccaceae bacterium]|nr:histidine phosphatase family protein [Porticoccaceae bacterium]